MRQCVSRNGWQLTLQLLICTRKVPRAHQGNICDAEKDVEDYYQNRPNINSACGRLGYSLGFPFCPYFPSISPLNTWIIYFFGASSSLLRACIRRKIISFILFSRVIIILFYRTIIILFYYYSLLNSTILVLWIFLDPFFFIYSSKVF